MGSELLKRGIEDGEPIVAKYMVNGRTTIAPRSLWQYAYTERLVGSNCRECLDHVIAFGEAHLWRILKAYIRCYNGARTHLSPKKDAPISRLIKRVGHISSMPILGGPHHQCFRT
jgi:hypothetical protein